jgi:hypothetical protein
MENAKENQKSSSSGKKAGRPPGSLNKATRQFRETVNMLLEENADNVSKWLEMVAYGDGDQLKPDPKGALDIMSKLAEYATPKLARQEHVGDDGKDIAMTIKWVE